MECDSGGGQTDTRGDMKGFVCDVEPGRQQCMRVGVMCCLGLMSVRTLATEFCMYWCLSRVLLDTPNRTPFQ